MLNTLKHLVEQMPPWFRETPAGQAVLDEQRTKEERTRREAIDEIAAARAAHVERVPALDAAVEKERTAVKKIEASLTAANRRLIEAVVARQQSRADADTIERQHGAMLTTTAPACIAEFTHELRFAAGRIRSAGLTETSERATATRNTGGAAKVLFYSNAAGQVAVLRAIVDALRHAQTLHERVATEAEALDAIAHLRSTLHVERLNEMRPVGSTAA
jgi:hypothetical protein